MSLKDARQFQSPRRYKARRAIVEIVAGLLFLLVLLVRFLPPQATGDSVTGRLQKKPVSLIQPSIQREDLLRHLWEDSTSCRIH